MPKIVCYVPTYSPNDEAKETRPHIRLAQEQILERTKSQDGRIKPGMYLDSIDSVLNTRPDIQLIVGDGRSSESIRRDLIRHMGESKGYNIRLYPEKMSQWAIFNDIYKDNLDADYFIYSSSDVIWHMDWVAEAIKEFDKNPKLQILFPLVSQGDGNIPCQVAKEARNQDPIKPPYDPYGQAPVLNAYTMIFRMDFLRLYGGYPNVFRNCYTESFLHFMCEAMGGEMRLLPRGHVFHWGLGDKWQENGSHYYYDEENHVFKEIMHQTQLARAARMLSVDFLKGALYKENA